MFGGILVGSDWARFAGALAQSVGRKEHAQPTGWLLDTYLTLEVEPVVARSTNRLSVIRAVNTAGPDAIGTRAHLERTLTVALVCLFLGLILGVAADRMSPAQAAICQRGLLDHVLGERVADDDRQTDTVRRGTGSGRARRLASCVELATPPRLALRIAVIVQRLECAIGARVAGAPGGIAVRRHVLTSRTYGLRGATGNAMVGKRLVCVRPARIALPSNFLRISRDGRTSRTLVLRFAGRAAVAGCVLVLVGAARDARTSERLVGPNEARSGAAEHMRFALAGTVIN
ncbi:MAG: hypothetical protein CMK50_03760 [Propionibacteriaceae bacterium]|nr:hypothetical protein [Propionibacteriaceae bacterium]